MRSLCDRYTSAQLMRPDSALNRQGIGLAKGLASRLGIPVYYRMFDDGGRRVRRVRNGRCLFRLCPCCGNAMRRVRFSQERELEACDSCGLSSEPAVE